MAKFKKKKSNPTPDSDESKNNSEIQNNSTSKENEIPETENSDIPPTEDSSPPSTEKTEKPKKEKVLTDSESSESKKKLDKLFWLRIVLAVLAGTAATFIFEPIEGEERRWSSIVFMIIIFIVSVIIAKGMRIQLASSDRKKIVTQGLGSYVFIYLFIWIVTYTLVNISETGTGLSSPIP